LIDAEFVVPEAIFFMTPVTRSASTISGQSRFCDQTSQHHRRRFDWSLIENLAHSQGLRGKSSAIFASFSLRRSGRPTRAGDMRFAAPVDVTEAS